MRRDAVVIEFRPPCNPGWRPRIAIDRRTSTLGARHEILRVEMRLAPGFSPGFEEALRRGGEVPPGGAPLLLVAAQSCGGYTPAKQVALESLRRIR